MIQYFRPNTDDDRFVIPEIIDRDMYRMPMMAHELAGHQGTILDGGGHIGATAVMFATHFPENRIVVYEPEPDNFELLMNNLHRFPQVEFKPKALGNGIGTLRLWANGDTGRFSAIRKLGEESFLAKVVPLEEEIVCRAPILILKLDLEGYETYLVNRLSDTALEAVEVLILETHQWGEPLDYARLERAGFREWFRAFDDPRHTVYRKADPLNPDEWIRRVA